MTICTDLNHKHTHIYSVTGGTSNSFLLLPVNPAENNVPPPKLIFFFLSLDQVPTQVHKLSWPTRIVITIIIIIITIIIITVTVTVAIPFQTPTPHHFSFIKLHITILLNWSPDSLPLSGLTLFHHQSILSLILILTSPFHYPFTVIILSFIYYLFFIAGIEHLWLSSNTGLHLGILDYPKDCWTSLVETNDENSFSKQKRNLGCQLLSVFQCHLSLYTTDY